MSKTLIVSTSSIDDELRGATIRLKTLNRYFNIGEKYIYVPTFFKKGHFIKDQINVQFFPLTIIDLIKIPFLLIKGLPLSNVIFRRTKIKNNLHIFDNVIFHLIRTIQDYSCPQNITIDVCESLSKNFHLRSENMKRNSLKRILFLYESKRLKKFEKEICSSNIEKKLFISDKDHLIKTCTNYEILPNMPTFNMEPNISNNLDYKKTVFIGHVDYEPNLTSIKNTSIILNEIDSSIKLHVVGRYNKNSKDLLSSCKNIILHGFIDEIDDIFENAVCGFAIIKNCTGMQNKVLDYFSYSLPSIVSKEVQDGLPETSPALVCDTKEQVKDALNALTKLNDRENLIRQGHNYLKKIEESFVNKRNQT